MQNLQSYQQFEAVVLDPAILFPMILVVAQLHLNERRGSP
jgi:hypothetical protein